MIGSAEGRMLVPYRGESLTTGEEHENKTSGKGIRGGCRGHTVIRAERWRCKENRRTGQCQYASKE